MRVPAAVRPPTPSTIVAPSRRPPRRLVIARIPCRAGRRGASLLPASRRYQHLAVGFGNDDTILIAGHAGEHDHAAAVPRLGMERSHRPRRRQRIAGAHRCEKARRVLEVRKRGAVEVHADGRTHQRTGDHAMEDPRAEPRLFRVAVVDMMRIEIADEPGADHEVRVGDRDRARKRVADGDLVVAASAPVQPQARRWFHPALPADGSALRARSAASSSRHRHVNARPA